MPQRYVAHDACNNAIIMIVEVVPLQLIQFSSAILDIRVCI